MLVAIVGMKVILTAHQFFPDFSSGTEVLTLSVGRELLQRGHDVYVYTGSPACHEPGNDPLFEDYEFEGIKVYRFQDSSRAIKGRQSIIESTYNNRLAAEFFGSLLERIRPDVVTFFHLHRLGSGLVDKAIEVQVPSFLVPTDFWPICHTAQLQLPDGSTCHGPTAHGGNCIKHLGAHHQRRLVRFLARNTPVSLVDLVGNAGLWRQFAQYPLICEAAALESRLQINVERINRLRGILSPNSLMTQVLVRHGVRESLIREAAYGVDWTGGKTPAPRQGDRLRVGFIGTLAEHKGCHILIEAFKAAFSLHEATLKIYGEGHTEYVGQLKAAAKDRDDISFCGTFPNAIINSIFAELDVLIVPSIWIENTPLVVYSAQAAQCPVIASDLPGLSACISHSYNGLLFEAGNSQALATQLRHLAEEQHLLSDLRNNISPPKSTAHYVDELLELWSLD